MKTFDEALRLIMRPELNAESFATNMAEMQEDLEARRGICEEISNHKTCEEMVHQLVHVMMGNNDREVGCQEITKIALAMFINGVLIGMEMNRMDLPMPSFPPD